MKMMPHYPITTQDLQKYHEKEIEFRKIPIQQGPHAGFRVSGMGKLMISTNGHEGRAEIFVEKWFGDHGETQIFHLAEVPFRSIVTVANGFLLDWSDKA
jgi:hypothetical protein